MGTRKNIFLSQRLRLQELLDTVQENILELQHIVEYYGRQGYGAEIPTEGWSERAWALDTYMVAENKAFTHLIELQKRFAKLEQALPTSCPKCGGFTDADGEPEVYGCDLDWALFDVVHTWCIGVTEFWAPKKWPDEGWEHIEGRFKEPCGWSNTKRILKQSGGNC